MEEKLRQHQPIIAGLKIVIAIAATEFIIMVALRLSGAYTSMSPYVLDLVDTLVLSLAASIIIVYWVIRPMKLSQELLQNEKALRVSEDRYRSLFENMLEGYAYCKILLDHDKPEDFMYIDVNHTFEELTGLKNVVGKKVSEVIPGIKESNPELFEIFGRVAFTGKPDRFETYLESLGIWFSIAVYSPGKEYFVAVFDNITEHKRAEEEPQKLSSTVEQTADSIVITNKDGIIEYVNPAFEKLTGYTKEEVLGKTPRILKSGEQDQKYYEELWGAILSGRIFRAVVVNKKKNGELYYEEKTITPIVNKNGIITHFVSIDKDISERKRAEKELKNSEERFRSVWEGSIDGMRITDKEGTIVAVNDAYGTLVGVKREELEGQSFNVPYRSSDEEEQTATQRYRDRFSTRTIVPKMEARLELRSGNMSRVEISNAFVESGGSDPLLLSIFRDVTERKHAEETKKNLEGQLQQAQKLESIGTLASGIAHDFNNILGIILGYSTLLERLRENPQQHSESVAAITKATQRGASLVKQLLIFARKTEVLFETVSINDMIGELNKLLKETFPKTITISTSLQQDLRAIVADASQIHQVLLNLLVNARDAMPKSGTLSISTRTIEGEDVSSRFAKATGYPVTRQYVQIEVADTGIGMDETTRQRIFEPFFTTKGPGKGTGLGLSVVFGIVERHSGFIDVRSAPGEGTSFSVYLPIPERALEEVQAAGKNFEEIPGGTETILIIEDEEMLRELVKASLVSKGYTVLTSEDGIQGVEMYQSHQKEIAVVLSDIGLPLLSGQDVFIGIRKINPEAKVIMASGFIDPETKSEMYKAGLKNFIQKPYMQDEVLQKIRGAIDTTG